MVVSIIFASILYLLGVFFIPRRIVASPACCFLGLLILSMGKTAEGYPMLPLGNSLILGWLFMAVLVTILTLCQPPAIRKVNKGMMYYLVGSLTGLAIGLLGFTFTNTPGGRYVVMIVCVASATLLGGLIYARTPDGAPVAPASGRFFSYLFAKGFPVAISIMELGTPLVVIGI